MCCWPQSPRHDAAGTAPAQRPARKRRCTAFTGLCRPGTLPAPPVNYMQLAVDMTSISTSWLLRLHAAPCMHAIYTFSQQHTARSALSSRTASRDLGDGILHLCRQTSSEDVSRGQQREAAETLGTLDQRPESPVAERDRDNWQSEQSRNPGPMQWGVPAPNSFPNGCGPQMVYPQVKLSRSSRKPPHCRHYL